jgi:hypothetical protein
MRKDDPGTPGRQEAGDRSVLLATLLLVLLPAVAAEVLVLRLVAG